MNKKYFILLCISWLSFHACKQEKAVEGTPAPNFTVHTLQGKTHQLTDFQGKQIILNFWTITCKPCLEDFLVHQQLMNTLDKLPNQELIHICMDAEKDKIQRYLESHQLTLKNNFIANHVDELIGLYDIGAFPHHVVIDEMGIIQKNDYRELFNDLKAQ